MDRQGEAVSGNVVALLPETPTHWSTFAASFLAQTALFVFIANTSISFMAPVFDPVDTRESVHLVAPDLTPPPQEPIRVAQVKPAPKPSVPPNIQAKAPPPRPIEVPKVEVQKVEVAKVTPPPIAQVAKETRKPEVLSSGSSAPPTLPKPPRQVQTGGFGDPNGVPANPNALPSKGPVIAQVGSFDLPQGPGNGNGTGGSKGIPGTVKSAGFGNGVAGPGGPGNGPGGGGKVRSANFGSSEPPPIDTPKKQTASAPAKDTPVSLLSKPVPSYTAEARQRKIEGDVELEVEFTATGQVHVIRVVQGLGYGLDEAAVSAAEKIRFSPARRDGQAVDAEGRLKIIFRLS